MISTMFGKHLNAFHTSRQAFIKAETSETIRRALSETFNKFSSW